MGLLLHPEIRAVFEVSGSFNVTRAERNIDKPIIVVAVQECDVIMLDKMTRIQDRISYNYSGVA